MEILKSADEYSYTELPSKIKINIISRNLFFVHWTCNVEIGINIFIGGEKGKTFKTRGNSVLVYMLRVNSNASQNCDTDDDTKTGFSRRKLISTLTVTRQVSFLSVRPYDQYWGVVTNRVTLTNRDSAHIANPDTHAKLPGRMITMKMIGLHLITQHFEKHVRNYVTLKAFSACFLHRRGKSNKKKVRRKTNQTKQHDSTLLLSIANSFLLLTPRLHIYLTWNITIMTFIDAAINRLREITTPSWNPLTRRRRKSKFLFDDENLWIYFLFRFLMAIRCSPSAPSRRDNQVTVFSLVVCSMYL